MISAIALDLGSTSIKAGLLDQQGLLVNLVAEPVPTVSAHDGRYESDALAYAEVADKVLNRCLALTDEFPSLGLCSQRSSFLIWEQASGIPVTPLISWQDNRGTETCAMLQMHEPRIAALTGLRLAPYYFATKLRVVLQENPAWRERLQRGELLVGTLDTFLIWRWTSGKQYITDASMAARTLLMDIRKQEWSAELCDLFAIPQQILPAIQSSTGLKVPLDNGLTLQASLADQSAALVASVGDDSELALVNLGTGGFVIRYLAQHRKEVDGYLRTLVYQDSGSIAHFAIEGTINSIAAALASYPVADCKLEDLAATENIFCLAEPSGLGAPYFRNDLGLQFSASVEHLTQYEVACLLLEAIIFRVARIIEDFHKETAIRQVFLSGGLSELAALQQGIAQCLHCEAFRLLQRDASLQGAAMLASGLKNINHHEAEKIKLSLKNTALPEKYQRWKRWLDELLIT